MVVEALTSDAAHLLLAAATTVLALAVVYRIDRPNGSWTRRLRSRFLFGVPWGTLVAVAFVVCVYLFVQSGIDTPNRPVVIPFRAWSYFYPEGILWSGFAHAGLGHLTGNLLSALVAGTLAEYAYGHFPPERPGEGRFGSSERDVFRSPERDVFRSPERDVFRSPERDGSGPSVTDRVRRSVRMNPYVRAFVVVPGAILGFGLVASLFTLGPVIGFSGVVFALWGFALVHYPIGTVAALTGATLANVVYATIRTPVEFAEATPSFGPPGWANVAVQGHALGLIGGVLVAVWLRRRRRDGDTAAHTSAIAVFGAVLLFGASRRLWAVYWYLGNQRFELYRAVGFALLVVLALVVAVAVAGRDEPIRPALADTVPDAAPDTIRGSVAEATPAAVGLVVLVVAFAAVAGPAIVPNLGTVDDGKAPGDPIPVEGYEVTYAEDVENRMVSVIDVEAFGRSTSVRTSGVIVRNADRGIWTTAVSRGNLAFWGDRTVDVGGTGWRETVRIERTGWVPTGGNATYRVDAVHEGARSTLFVSNATRAEPVLDGRNVTIAAGAERFELRVEHGNATRSAPVPGTNESVTLRGVEFVREDRALFAERGDTRVRVANRERYEGRELRE